jgi:hypothetical protein
MKYALIAALLLTTPAVAKEQWLPIYVVTTTSGEWLAQQRASAGPYDTYRECLQDIRKINAKTKDPVPHHYECQISPRLARISPRLAREIARINRRMERAARWNSPPPSTGETKLQHDFMWNATPPMGPLVP